MFLGVCAEKDLILVVKVGFLRCFCVCVCVF